MKKLYADEAALKAVDEDDKQAATDYLARCLGPLFDHMRWFRDFCHLDKQWMHSYIEGPRLQLFALFCYGRAQKKHGQSKTKNKEKKISYALALQGWGIQLILERNIPGVEDSSTLREKSWEDWADQQ